MIQREIFEKERCGRCKIEHINGSFTSASKLKCYSEYLESLNEEMVEAIKMVLSKETLDWSILKYLSQFLERVKGQSIEEILKKKE